MTNLLLFAADIGGDTMEKSGESSKDMADFLNYIYEWSAAYNGYDFWHYYNVHRDFINCGGDA